MPIALDELQDRDVIGVAVADVPALREVRNDDQWNARSVAEKVDRLDVARVVKTAALIESDDESCLRHELRICVETIERFLDHAFEQVELRGSRVAVEQPVRFHA